jgi:D-inositol-3-phosphate glycosyltransferase
MKIVIVGPSRPYRGGIAQFSDELSNAVRLRGHEVRMETFKRQYPSFLFPGKTQLDGSLRDLPAGTVARLDSVNPLSWWKTARRIRKIDPDVVVFAYWLGFMAPAYNSIARAARRAGIPLVVLVHNAISHEKRIGDQWLGQTFFRKTNRLIALSNAVATDLREMGFGERVVEAGHPVYTHFGKERDRDSARTDLHLPLDAPVALFFGFIRRYKGLDVLIEALPSILTKKPEFKLVVAGEFYEDEEAIRERVKELGIGRSVIFHSEYIPNERVATYFSAADLVVQPYRTATQSGVAHVAFHFGRPMVITNVGGLAETVPGGEAGMVVPPENPKALAEAMCSFFSDDSLRQRLTAGARLERGSFTWHALAELIEDAAI